jgi:hypothetical protein
MQKRHFVVREVDGDYQLKEVDATIANSMSHFGITMGEYHTVEVSNIFFYFCPMTAHRANEIAARLSEKVLSGEA